MITAKHVRRGLRFGIVFTLGGIAYPFMYTAPMVNLGIIAVAAIIDGIVNSMEANES